MPYSDKEKQRAAQKAYYDRNKNKVKSVARDRRNFVVKYLQELKQKSGCMDCGIMYPYWVLQFDHRPGEIKSGNISQMITNTSLEVVKLEVAKCDVVCANCHADRTHSRMITSGAGVMVLDELS